MSKFKIGDKVKIVRSVSPLISIDRFRDKEYTIKNFDMAWNRNGYIYKLCEENLYSWYESELELVKPKFDINEYPGKYVMHVTTEKQAKIFCKYLHSLDKRWSSGCSYISKTFYHVCENDTCYYFNEGQYSNLNFYKEYSFIILEFEDFDWSDFEMKKEFTKADLKNGDVVKISDGIIGIVCLETDTIIQKVGYDEISDLTDDLKFKHSTNNAQIIAVRRPNKAYACRFDAFEKELGTLVYERKEVEEMTLEEVCKALGKEIKIVKK